MRTVVAITIAGLALLAACEEQSTEPREPNAINEGAGSRLGNASPALRNVEVQTRFKTISEALTAFQTLNGELPESLQALVDDNSLTKGMIVDPWENEFRYETTPSGFNLWSVGEDGENGTDDDIQMKR